MNLNRFDITIMCAILVHSGMNVANVYRDIFNPFIDKGEGFIFNNQRNHK